MKLIYDRESDTLSIILRDGKVAESDEAREGLILDYDKAGYLISLELLDASEQIKQPESVEFALADKGSPLAVVREKPDKPYGKWKP
jgi:uncharacterized protein YuzE